METEEINYVYLCICKKMVSLNSEKVQKRLFRRKIKTFVMNFHDSLIPEPDSDRSFYKTRIWNILQLNIYEFKSFSNEKIVILLCDIYEDPQTSGEASNTSERT